MVAVKERLMCQHCGNHLFGKEENILTCITCGRDHDENGHLIQHPVGKIQERFDGYANQNYGPRLVNQKSLK